MYSNMGPVGGKRASYPLNINGYDLRSLLRKRTSFAVRKRRVWFYFLTTVIRNLKNIWKKVVFFLESKSSAFFVLCYWTHCGWILAYPGWITWVC